MPESPSSGTVITKRTRRTFLQPSTAALAAGLSPIGPALKDGVSTNSLAANLTAKQSAPTVPANEGKKPLRLGLILGIGRDPNDAISKVHDLGMPTCQAFVDESDSEFAARLRPA